MIRKVAASANEGFIVNFAEENLRPVACYLSEQAHAIGIEFEPFEFIVDGESSEQDEPELNFNGFQLPTSDLSRLANQKFDIQASPDRCDVFGVPQGERGGVVPFPVVEVVNGPEHDIEFLLREPRAEVAGTAAVVVGLDAEQDRDVAGFLCGAHPFNIGGEEGYIHAVFVVVTVG